MKKLILPVFTVCLMLTLGFFSCKKETDKCADTVCLYDGTCVDGKCQCPDGFSGDSCQITPTCDPGYEGIHCEFEMRAKFIGSFQPSWFCNSDSQSLFTRARAYISAHNSGLTKIYIDRIHGNMGAICTVNGQYLTIDEVVPANSDTLITGYGFCEGFNSAVTINYTLSTATTGFVDSCRIVYVHP